jgi:hypothetical protein
MKVNLESTTKMTGLIIGGATVPARIWEGVTESGVKVHAYITRIAVAHGEDSRQFEQELLEQRAPSPAVEAIPLRLIL